MSPLEAFIQWFDDLPHDQQAEIAATILLVAPDVTVEQIMSPSHDDVDAFRRWVLRPELLPSKRAGKALLIRSALNTCLFPGKTAPDPERYEHWAEQIRAEGQPELAEHFAKAASEEPFRSRLWQRSLDGWEVLCAGAFSDESLNTFAVGSAK